jgi:hypothetical protein
VERDGRWWSEADSCWVDSPSHRYVLNAKMADHTGEMYVSFFNEQVGGWVVK